PRDTPFVIEVEKDMRVRDLTVSAPGYQTKRHQIRYDQAQEVTVRLLPEVTAVDVTPATASAEPKLATDKLEPKKHTKPKKSEEGSAVRPPEPKTPAGTTEVKPGVNPRG